MTNLKHFTLKMFGRKIEYPIKTSEGYLNELHIDFCNQNLLISLIFIEGIKMKKIESYLTNVMKLISRPEEVLLVKLDASTYFL